MFGSTDRSTAGYPSSQEIKSEITDAESDWSPLTVKINTRSGSDFKLYTREGEMWCLLVRFRVNETDSK